LALLAELESYGYEATSGPPIESREDAEGREDPQDEEPTSKLAHLLDFVQDAEKQNSK